MNIKNIKKRMAAGLAALLVFGVTSKTIVQADTSVVDPTETAVCISPGEYEGKPGKRASAECVEKAGVTGYKLYSDGSLGEFEINRKIVDKVEEYIKANNRFIKVIRFDRKDKSEDLGAAGRRAASTNADLYIGLHTNSDGKSIGTATGFELFTPQNREIRRNGKYFCTVKYQDISERIASSIVNSMNMDNAGIKLHGSGGLHRNSTGYDEINTSSEIMPSLISEFGFALSNPEDLKKLTSSEYINAISMEFAKGLVNEIVKAEYQNDQEIEKEKKAKKEESSAEKEEKVITEVPEEKPVEENKPEEEIKDIPVIDESLEKTPEDTEHIDEDGLKSGRMNVYVEGKEYDVELDTEKDSDTAVTEYNNTVNNLIDKYNIDVEGEGINE